MSPSSVEDPRNWLGFIPATLKDSPLYSELWEHIKKDAEILAFVNLVDKDQPILVTFLLLREPHQPYAAIWFARQKGISLHEGDACDLLPALLDAIPQQHTVVVWSSYAVNQGPLDVKERIDAQIAEASHGRMLYRISLEFALEKQAGGPRLELSEYQDGQVVKQELLACCAVHGENMTWLKEQDTL